MGVVLFEHEKLKSFLPQRQPQMWAPPQQHPGALHSPQEHPQPRCARAEPSNFQSQMGTGGCRAGNWNNLGFWYAKHSRHCSCNFLLRVKVWLVKPGSLMRKHMSWLPKQIAGSTELRLQHISRECTIGLCKETELRSFSHGSFCYTEEISLKCLVA